MAPACISHHLTAAARDKTAMTSLRLLGVLDVGSSTPARAQRLAPRPAGPPTHFASPRGEKYRPAGNGARADTPDLSAFEGVDFSEAEHRNVIIIGSGPAGFTAALYAARANLEPLLFQGPEAGGQLVTTTDVENYPGFPGRCSGARHDAQVRGPGETLRG